MAYLVLAQTGIDKERRRWCNRQLVRCGTSAWLSPLPVEHPCLVSTPVGNSTLAGLEAAMEEAVSAHFMNAHATIMDGATGPRLQRAAYLFNMIRAVSPNIRVVSEAQTHLAAIGKMTPIEAVKEEKTPRTALGYDTKSAKEFILGLAKKDTMG
jgi:hypothetical protein